MSEQADELKAHEEELIGIIEKRSLEMERANQLQEAYDNYNSSMIHLSAHLKIL